MLDVEIHLLIASLALFLLAIVIAVTQHIRILPQVSLSYQLGWKSPKKGTNKERRIYLRHKTLLRAKYKTDAEQGISWISDISRGGLRLFLANKTCTIGAPLQIEIDLPHSQKPISAQGNIVWMKEGEAGLNFSDVKQYDVNRIIQYIGEKERHGN
ncbi:MAG: PilZ domain-containing protein [Candidatus Omnitrophota bacterium]